MKVDILTACEEAKGICTDCILTAYCSERDAQPENNISSEDEFPYEEE